MVSALDFQTLILSSIPVEVSLSALSLQPESSNKTFSVSITRLSRSTSLVKNPLSMALSLRLKVLPIDF